MEYRIGKPTAHCTILSTCATSQIRKETQEALFLLLSEIHGLEESSIHGLEESSTIAIATGIRNKMREDVELLATGCFLESLAISAGKKQPFYGPLAEQCAQGRKACLESLQAASERAHVVMNAILGGGAILGYSEVSTEEEVDRTCSIQKNRFPSLLSGWICAQCADPLATPPCFSSSVNAMDTDQSQNFLGEDRVCVLARQCKKDLAFYGCAVVNQLIPHNQITVLQQAADVTAYANGLFDPGSNAASCHTGKAGYKKCYSAQGWFKIADCAIMHFAGLIPDLLFLMALVYDTDMAHITSSYYGCKLYRPPKERDFDLDLLVTAGSAEAIKRTGADCTRT